MVEVPKNANITVALVLVNNSMEIHLNQVSGLATCRTCLNWYWKFDKIYDFVKNIWIWSKYVKLKLHWRRYWWWLFMLVHVFLYYYVLYFHLPKYVVDHLGYYHYVETYWINNFNFQLTTTTSTWSRQGHCLTEWQRVRRSESAGRALYVQLACE